MTGPLLSIITPTYNRSKFLQKCYESLCQQTDFDFEWIIIDDGSSDCTDQIVRTFQSAFPIFYQWKENGGKHTALNLAHQFIHGAYVLILDSDDLLLPTAVEQVKTAWARYEDDPSIGIVTFLKGKSEDEPVCMARNENTPVDIMRYRRKCFFGADCCEVIRAELFLLYPFPVFEGESFLSEGALWNRVSFTHQCVYINRVIYICEYQQDGLTKAGRRLRVHNPQGGMYTANLNMHQKNYFSRRIKNGLLYTCYGFFAHKSAWMIVHTSDHKLLTSVCLPFGLLLYRYWKMKTK